MRKRKALPWLAVPVLAVSAVFAQTDNTDEDVYELSPFEVDGSKDDGYYATNTLAGTRLNSSIKDVAAPISVLTKELMDDVGATDVQDVLVYSVNVQNENEYAPDDTEGESISSTVQTRVRGISGGTPTRGYFKTLYRTDGYNTDRITVARGPNSILFGLGNPAGVIDASPIKANLSKFKGSVGLRFDNWGSVRATADFNLPIHEDVFAIRVAAMDQEKKTFRDPEYDDERRRFITATFKPFKNTIIRASFEDMVNDRVRARRQLPYDRVSNWLEIGQPLYDHTTGLWTQDDGATWVDASVIEAQYPDSNLSRWVAMEEGAEPIDSEGRVHVAGGGIGDASTYQGLDWRNTGLSYDPYEIPRRTFKNGDLIDLDNNYYGEGSMSALKGDIANISLEQKIIDNLHLSVAYRLENFERSQDEMIRQGLGGIKADVNYYVPYELDIETGYPVDPDTGDAFDPNEAWRPDAKTAVNPNRGRIMIDSQYLGWTQTSEMESTRAMLTYALDFDRWDMGFLGRHVMGVMYQDEREDTFKFKRRLISQGDYYVGRNGSRSLTDNGNVNDNNVKTRFYLDLPGMPDENGITQPGPLVMPPWDARIGPFGNDGVPRTTRNEIESTLAVIQSFLFDESLVLTFGYRDDTQKFDSTSVSARNPDSGEWDYSDGSFSGDPAKDSGITRTYGVVYHTPIDGLSLTYNRADTFNPNVGNLTWDLEPLGPNTGEGEDYGINLSLFGGKLNARMSYYTNTSIDALELDWYYEQPKWSLIMAMDAPWGPIKTYNNRVNNGAITYPEGFSAEDVHVITPWQIQGGTDAIRATRDYESEGYELELFYKPTPQLDIRLTLAKVEAINVRVVPYAVEYVESRLPVWEKYFALPAGRQFWGAFPDALPDWETNPASLGYTFINEPSRLPRVLEFSEAAGSSSMRNREWRANLMVNYRFRENLRGLSVGGAARYRSAATIGYYGKPNRYPDSPIEVPDVTKPIDGDDIIEFDAWVRYRKPIKLLGSDMTWIIALNVQNLFDDDDLIPLRTHTTGEVVDWAVKAPRTDRKSVV